MTDQQKNAQADAQANNNDKTTSQMTEMLSRSGLCDSGTLSTSSLAPLPSGLASNNNSSASSTLHAHFAEQKPRSAERSSGVYNGGKVSPAGRSSNTSSRPTSAAGSRGINGPSGIGNNSLASAQGGESGYSRSSALVKRLFGTEGKEQQQANDSSKHVLLAATGAIGAAKLRLIIEQLFSVYGRNGAIKMHVILTKSALHFISRGEIPSGVTIWTDEDEWACWNSRSDPVLHIELRRWAHALVIAPCSANTLGKIAMGLCDNLLTCVVRAWNMGKPILLATSLDPYTYKNPMSRQHVDSIKLNMPWIQVLKPVEKVAIEGEIGMGGMRDWNELADMIVVKLGGYPIEEDDDDDEEEEEGGDSSRNESRNPIDDSYDDDDDVDEDDNDRTEHPVDDNGDSIIDSSSSGSEDDDEDEDDEANPATITTSISNNSNESVPRGRSQTAANNMT